jgi:hypothetical protein
MTDATQPPTPEAMTADDERRLNDIRTWVATHTAAFARSSWTPDHIRFLLRMIDASAARARAEERERCSQVCLTIETELMASAEKYHAARRYDEYERLESEATTVSIVKDRIRALSDVEPVR